MKNGLIKVRIYYSTFELEIGMCAPVILNKYLDYFSILTKRQQLCLPVNIFLTVPTIYYTKAWVD